MAHQTDVSAGIFIHHNANVQLAFVILFDEFDRCDFAFEREIENIAAGARPQPDAFAASHLTHAASIIALAALHPAAFHAAAGEMPRLPGLVGYGLLLAMAVTSFDRTAAWLGPRAWKVLHTTGSIYLWGAFTNAFVSRALRMPAYAPAAALAIAAMVLRIVAWRRGARAR